jgi:hypothetical protein
MPPVDLNPGGETTLWHVQHPIAQSFCSSKMYTAFKSLTEFEFAEAPYINPYTQKTAKILSGV